MPKRRPAYQRYPKEWINHTAHLSLAAAGFLDRLQCWIWDHAEDQCSIADDPAAIAIATRVPPDQIETYMAEIMNPHMPLMKRRSGRLVVGHFESQMQTHSEKSEKARDAANRRWKNAVASENHANASETNANAQKNDANGMHCYSRLQLQNAVEETEGGGAGGGRVPDDFERALELVNSAVPNAWRRNIWSRTEAESLRSGAITEIEELSAHDWQNLRDWFAAKIPEGFSDPPRRVQSRSRLIENLVNEADKAAAWLKSNPSFRRKPKKPRSAPEKPQEPVEEEMTEDTAAAIQSLKTSILRTA